MSDCRNGGRNVYEFAPARPGEGPRACCECGAEFEPASSNQKRCPACREARKPRGNDRTPEKEARKQMDYNQIGLNAAMFRELERIEACETPEQIEAEGVRADKVCNLASNIIANGRLMVQAAQMSMDVGMAVNVPKALLGNGDGR